MGLALALTRLELALTLTLTLTLTLALALTLTLSQAQQNSRLANRDSVGADNMLQPDSAGGAATQGGARAMGAVRQGQAPTLDLTLAL